MGKIDLDNFLKNNKVVFMNNIPKIKNFFLITKIIKIYYSFLIKLMKLTLKINFYP